MLNFPRFHCLSSYLSSLNCHLKIWLFLKAFAVLHSCSFKNNVKNDAVWAVDNLTSSCELQNYLINMGLSGSFSNNFVDDDFESARELHQERMAELRRRQRAAEIRQVIIYNFDELLMKF